MSFSEDELAEPQLAQRKIDKVTGLLEYAKTGIAKAKRATS